MQVVNWICSSFLNSRCGCKEPMTHAIPSWAPCLTASVSLVPEEACRARSQFLEMDSLFPSCRTLIHARYRCSSDERIVIAACVLCILIVARVHTTNSQLVGQTLHRYSYLSISARSIQRTLCLRRWTSITIGLIKDPVVYHDPLTRSLKSFNLCTTHILPCLPVLRIPACKSLFVLELQYRLD